MGLFGVRLADSAHCPDQISQNSEHSVQRIPTDILLEKDRVLKITTIESEGWYINFRAFGAYNSRKPESIDAVEYISEFTKAELFLFRTVCEHTAKNCTITLRPRSFSPAEQAKLKKAIPLWIKKRLLKRIKREYYVVNPWFLVPPKKEHLKVMRQWSELNQQVRRR